MIAADIRRSSLPSARSVHEAAPADLAAGVDLIFEPSCLPGHEFFLEELAVPDGNFSAVRLCIRNSRACSLAYFLGTCSSFSTVYAPPPSLSLSLSLRSSHSEQSRNVAQILVWKNAETAPLPLPCFPRYGSAACACTCVCTCIFI
jgi:hypothetical protein